MLLVLLLGGELRMVERRTERRKTNTGDEDEEREADLAAPGLPFSPDARYRRKTPSPFPIYVWVMDYLYIYIYMHRPQDRTGYALICTTRTHMCGQQETRNLLRLRPMFTLRFICYTTPNGFSACARSPTSFSNGHLLKPIPL